MRVLIVLMFQHIFSDIYAIIQQSSVSTLKTTALLLL